MPGAGAATGPQELRTQDNETERPSEPHDARPQRLSRPTQFHDGPEAESEEQIEGVHSQEGTTQRDK